ncbi:3361_t:CDS:2, partial [Acaulospora morrowiae]
VPTFINKPPVEFDQGGLRKRLCLAGIRRRVVSGPLHDPNAPNAIVLYDPNDDEEVKPKQEEIKTKNKSVADILGFKNEANKIVHVVVDPVLGNKLRPHQIEGVKFLYNCTTGRVVENAHGCIMADEMGLGKTLQCITLLWTLLKQSPEAGKKTIEKCIIVCPSSLVHNWANELVKWLGSIRIKSLVMDNKGSKENTLKALRYFA